MLLELNDINRSLRQDPAAYIAQCDALYGQRVQDAADQIKERLRHSRIILLSGPSASGKTTTASRLKKALYERGIYCHMISLDDYYKSKSTPGFPRTKDGSPDLESPLALETELLNEHLNLLDRGEKILVPHFDFQNQRQAPEAARPLQLRENEAVIFEGIHGLNPMLTDRNPEATRLFVSTASSVAHRNMEVFNRVWMRVVRRMVRDFNFRAASAEETLGMWRNVRLGEKRYISPYKSSAHITIDTTHGYEVSAFRPFAEPMLRSLQHNAQPELTEKILAGLVQFEPVEVSLLPRDSLFMEEFMK